MRYLIRNHQDKSAPYELALREAGHTHGSVDDADVVLIDFDLPHPAYNGWVQLAGDLGAALIVYPHGFTTTMVQDIVGEPVQVDASFVPGPGQKQLMERFGYPNPVHVAGWPGPRLQAEPRECERVLFAPHHPLGSGYMQPDCWEANAKAFECLLAEPFDLSVRHVGTLEQNGLWEVDGVEYIQGVMNGSLHAADVVVAGGTYAANCIACGIPVVMYDQQREWRMEAEDREETAFPAGWEEWADFTRYPYDLAPGVCEQAAADPQISAVRKWQEAFIGPPFDPKGFARLVEDIAERKEASCRRSTA